MALKKREKVLAGIVVASLLLMGGGVGLHRFFKAPLRKEQQVIRVLQEKLARAERERRDFFTAEDQLKKVAQRSFGDSLDVASARSGELVVNAIADAGLSETQFTRIATGPRRLRGASEIGWTVQGRGPLPKVLDLLFLLDKSPYLHRLENVTLTASERQGEIKVRFIFLTLVMTPPPPFEPLEEIPGANLLSAERQLYKPLVDRDIWRPYVPRPPPPPAPPVREPPPPAVADAPQPPPGPALDTLRVVSLSSWGGQPEVHVRSLADNRLLAFQPGDDLFGSLIVAVDYRPQPSPVNPLLRSDSRIILKEGGEYWAVERGQTLADRRKLDPATWPAK